MKRKFSILAIAIAACLALSGCRLLTQEDMIPEHLGEPEGLWLYKGNERMRTDGSEQASLFEDIEIDGETVADFSIDQYLYCTDAGTAFFSLEVDTKYYLYLFDYVEKSGQILWETQNRLSMSSSDECVFVSTSRNGLLYRHDGELLSADIGTGFFFQDGLLCRITDTAFCWWEEDGLHSITPSGLTWETRRYSHSDYFVQNRIFCFVGNGTVFFIDLEQETLTDLAYEGKWSQQRQIDEAAYFLTYTSPDSPYNYRLYEVKDGTLRLACTFPSEAKVSFGNCGDGTINFVCDYRSAAQIESVEGAPAPVLTSSGTTAYCYYSIKDGKLRDGSIEIAKKAEDADAFVCGEYSFWVSYRAYGGWFDGGRCYYLNRKHDGIEEIMQYSFDNDGYFFDDTRAK